MKNLLLIATILLVFNACNCDKSALTQLKEATPQEAGFSASRLAQADSLINEYIQKNWLPGGVFLLARHGAIVYYKNFGSRSTARDIPYQKDDIFRIASMTKAITTVSVMKLYEQGKLLLDDPVSKYIPSFKNQVVLDTFNPKDSSFTTVPAERPVTLRMLLTHTSGIVYGDFNAGKLQAVYSKFDMLHQGLSSNHWTTEEFINQLAEVPLAFQPGQRFAYGLNMDVLGRVIEVVSGQTLSEYFKENIFDPLGMTDTYFYLPENKQNRLVPIYSQNNDGTVSMATGAGLVNLIDYPRQKDSGYYAGGGGLSSTAMDYARFIEALVNKGSYNKYRLLGRKTIEIMTADQMIALNKKGTGYSNIPGNTYCLGFNLRTEEGAAINSKSPGTYEWGGYFSTKFFIDPKEDLIFVGMTQVLPFQHNEFYDKLTAIIYGAIED